MTAEEYITQKFSSFGYTPTAADVLDITVSAGLTTEDEITSDNVELMGVGICNFIPSLLARPQSISENGFSVSWNADGLKKYYNYLCNRYGITDELSDAPRITFL